MLYGLPSHLLFVWVFLFYFPLFHIENFFIFSTDCKNLVLISCFYFTFRILKVLMQVKTTFVTLHGVMSLLGSLWAKGRYVCLWHKFWVNVLWSCWILWFSEIGMQLFYGKNSFNICFLSAISQGILHFLFAFPCNAAGYEDFNCHLLSWRIQPWTSVFKMSH